MTRYNNINTNILYRGPKRIHADFLTLIAMSRNSSSETKYPPVIAKLEPIALVKYLTSSAYKKYCSTARTNSATNIGLVNIHSPGAG